MGHWALGMGHGTLGLVVPLSFSSPPLPTPHSLLPYHFAL